MVQSLSAAITFTRNPHMLNVVQAWLEMIGTPERAKRLQDESDWRECPSRQLFSAEESYRLYANPRYRAALDAWDTGLVTRRDILQWATYVASGGYHGGVYVPVALLG